MTRLDTLTGRGRLAIRDEPYFARLSKGRFVGFRKGVNGGAWTARYHPDEGKPKSKTLGELSDGFGYDQATEAARAWFAELDSGVTGRTDNGDEATVEIACRRYVEDRRRNKSEGCAHDNHKRFERTVYGSKKHEADPVVRVKLAKLRAHHVTGWRNGLKGLSKGSVNRNMTALRAALMLAMTDGIAGPHIVLELRKVKQHKNAGKRRTLYLDRKQRRALVDATKGGLRNLIEAAALTGCRAGELTAALVRDFDERQKTLSVKGKTGQRAVILAPSAVTLFTRLCEGRDAAEFLLTRDDGRHWSHSDWDELVKDAAKAAELPAATVLYTLRHSWITETLMSGMSTLEVARIAGTSLAMIEKHYGHLVADAASDRLAKVELI